MTTDKTEKLEVALVSDLQAVGVELIDLELKDSSSVITVERNGGLDLESLEFATRPSLSSSMPMRRSVPAGSYHPR